MEDRLEETVQEEELEEAFPKRRRWRKWITWLIILIVLIAAGGFGYHYYKSHKTKKATVTMPTAKVTRGSIDVTVSGSGSIQPVNTESILGPNSGTIQKVLVQKGDVVKKGQVIATLDNSKTQDQVNQDQVTLQKDQLDLSQTEDQLKQATDQNTIDNLKVSIKKSQLDMQSLQASIASLQDQMVQTNITAPINGTIDAINVKDGDSFNTNTTVAKITDYTSMELVTNVDELDISQVKLGKKAKITIDALPNQTFTGKVTDIAQQGTSSNGVATFPVTITLDSVKNVLSGMSAEASIQVQSKQNVLMLPIEAVQTNGKNHYVILASGQSAPVQAGSGQGGNSQSGSSQSGSSQSGSGQSGSGQGGTARSGQSGSGQGASGSVHSPSGHTSGGSGQGSGQGGYSANGSGGNNKSANGNGGQSGSNYGKAAAKGNSRGGQQGSSGRRIVQVQVGVHNTNYIEIVSGLNEGDVVQIPIQTASTTSQFQRGGAGGLGGLFGGGGGGRSYGGGGSRSGGSSSNRGGG